MDKTNYLIELQLLFLAALFCFVSVFSSLHASTAGTKQIAESLWRNGRNPSIHALPGSS